VKGYVYYFRDFYKVNGLCSLKWQCMCCSDIPFSSPAKEFWRCPNDLLDNFPACYTRQKRISLQDSGLYLLFEISDKNKSNML